MKPRYRIVDDKIISEKGIEFKIHCYNNLNDYYRETLNKPIYQVKKLPIGLEADNLEKIEIGEIKRVIDWYYYHIYLNKT